MMRRSKTTETDMEPVINPNLSAPSEGKTVIGKQITIEGTVQGKEDLLIEGTVKGSIELAEHHLTIGLNGQVESDIQAKSVTIKGRLTGKVNAFADVSITKEAEFNGEIYAKSISVENGAYLKAMIELEKESQKKNIHSIKLEDKSAPDTSQAPASLADGASEAK
jgi:cytoskeletal protein CcmA (bactofilin family)